MRALAIVLTLAVGFSAFADQESYITRIKGLAGAYLAFLARDCRTVYYLPKQYVIDPQASTVSYTREVTEMGNGDSVRPLLRIQLGLRPASEGLSDADREQLRTWGVKAGTGCAVKPEVAPYPALFVRMETGFGLERSAFAVKSASYKPDSTVAMVLEVDPLAVSADQLTSALEFYDPDMKISVFDLTNEIEAHLNIAYDVAAEFALHHYTESVCTEREQCITAFGIKLYCRRRYSCEDTPRVVQHLNALVLNQRAELNIFAKGVSERLVEEAKNQLMSRFMLGNFRELSRQSIEGVETVTLGEMNKHTSGTYSDQEIVQRVDQSEVKENLAIRGIGTALEPKLRPILESDEIKCLKGSHPSIIESNNPCFLQRGKP